MIKEYKQITVINGPNLNLLGKRETDVYPKITLEQIEEKMNLIAAQKSICLNFFQSNSESQLIEKIHSTITNKTQLIIINPAAFTHTSIALLDAILACSIPYIEVHLTNIYSREDFRAKSYFSKNAIGTISGFGDLSYLFALEAAINYLEQNG